VSVVAEVGASVTFVATRARQSTTRRRWDGGGQQFAILKRPTVRGSSTCAGPVLWRRHVTVFRAHSAHDHFILAHCEPNSSKMNFPTDFCTIFTAFFSCHHSPSSIRFRFVPKKKKKTGV
jgi:hypothetical protein